LQQVKRLFQAKKAGHTGSLDPIATGMLPICFGEATKFCQYLLDADKCYEVTGLLGVKTTTSDLSGSIVQQVENFVISEKNLRDVLVNFSGKIKQVPSMFSALKHQGTPLYKFARAGIEIERKARDITIHQLQLNAFDGKQLNLTVLCSKGTYIRNLIEDIGEHLNVGAHVIQLHRVYTTGFAEERMYTLEELSAFTAEQREQCLLPMERAVCHFPKLELTTSEALALRQGKTIHRDHMDSQGYVRLYEQAFMGLGELQMGILKVKRLLLERAVPDPDYRYDFG
jgi:tRNA pseudouridine55 synthase